MGQQVQRHRSPEAAPEVVDTDMPHVEPEVDLEAVDKLMADIDDILDVNAEEFLSNYTQVGGQ